MAEEFVFEISDEGPDQLALIAWSGDWAEISRVIQERVEELGPADRTLIRARVSGWKVSPDPGAEPEAPRLGCPPTQTRSEVKTEETNG